MRYERGLYLKRITIPEAIEIVDTIAKMDTIPGSIEESAINKLKTCGTSWLEVLDYILTELGTETSEDRYEQGHDAALKKVLKKMLYLIPTPKGPKSKKEKVRELGMALAELFSNFVENKELSIEKAEKRLLL